jgi:YegS/Rv2252/BmrU family lipid kinase
LRCFVVVNPAACRGKRAGIPREIAAALARHGLPFEIELTTHPGAARELVAAAGSAFDTIIVCGGDGTLHEALQAVDLERHVLGLVPAGTGNDFAWANGWPASVDACIARIAAAHERRVDLGLWNELRFHNSIGLGFEGRVNYESHRIRRLHGPAVYVAAVARALHERRPCPVRLEWDDGVWEGDVFLASVCIGGRVGGAFHLAPGARNDDGLFDLCVASDIDLRRLLWLLPRTFRGTHVRPPHVRLQRTTQLRIEACGRRVDGEFVGWEIRRRLLLRRALHLYINPGPRTAVPLALAPTGDTTWTRLRRRSLRPALREGRLARGVLPRTLRVPVVAHRRGRARSIGYRMDLQP